ncbi:MAG: hypothetical protein KC613_06020, partial [Myxococcales bacterium]|nr:hypothetical protein [Myxococcales bacterium]
DQLDGWGVNQPITIPFSGAIDVNSLLAGHRDPNYDFSNDVVYLIDVTPSSPEYGQLKALDMGEGNYPTALERFEYWDNDPRAWTTSIFFDEEDEDVNRNGKLDPGEDVNGNGVLDPGEDLDGDGELDWPEDTDSDGHLDVPNYLPGRRPARDDLAARADALMTFYEKETNTLITRPMEPLRERTTYAVVVTRRLLDAGGEPVGSPFKGIHHTSQAEALKDLGRFLPAGLGLSDVAFAFTFTTQSLQSHWVAVREGLYGYGVQKHIGQEFPAVLDGLEPLRDPEHRNFAGVDNVYILRSEEFMDAFSVLSQQLQGQEDGSLEFADLMNSHRYVDFHVIGRFKSPQLFERFAPEDASECPAACQAAASRCDLGELDCPAQCGEAMPAGYVSCLGAAKTCAETRRCVEVGADAERTQELRPWLPLNQQSWPVDLDLKPAKARAEDVRFWLTVPRKEVSARGEGKMPPLVIVGHGYTSNRFELAQFGGFFARHGMAAMAIDCVSHGLGISPDEERLGRSLLGAFGLERFGEAILTARAVDQNRDGTIDSAADFWTAYIFHTRDVVRQCALDYSQLIRIVKSFDGERRWAFDVNGDNENELAGDFDADGQVDIGAESLVGMTGGSLGGIMSMIMAGLEPHVDSVAPIAGGAGLGDIGNRSQQGGVREAVILRVMGPLFLGNLNEDGTYLLQQVIPDLNDTSRKPFAVIEGVNPGDTLVVENLDNGNRGCSFIDREGRARASLEADFGDHVEVHIYAGPQIMPGEGCVLREGVEPKIKVSEFGVEVQFQQTTYYEGEPLVTLAEGFGERRATPGMRRFLALGQLVLDGGDPGTYARHMLKEPLVFPSTGEQTGTHGVIVTTMGDMNVPASSGVTFGRAMGLIGYTEDDPRYGKPLNQVLLDTYTAEAVHSYGRHHDTAGNPVHLDIENFAEGNDLYGDTIPRLDPPLRIGVGQTDALGGKSAAIFPYNVPGGQHGFAFPGNDADRFIRNCRAACAEGEDCGCDNAWEGKYDVGRFMFNMLGQYMASGGKVLSLDACHASNSCDYEQPIPEPRQ